MLSQRQSLTAIEQSQVDLSFWIVEVSSLLEVLSSFGAIREESSRALQVHHSETIQGECVVLYEHKY